MGKISKRLRQLFDTELNRDIVPLKAYAQGKKKAEENLAAIKPVTELLKKGYDPLHALYIHVQNMLSFFAEEMSPLPPLHAWNDFFSEAEKTYCPGYPPMSPITKSFFSLWGLLDAAFGEDRETMGTIYIDMASYLGQGLDPQWIEVAKKMSDSRMGIYEVAGDSGKAFELSELLTDKKYEAIIPSGYTGRPGDLLYIRLAPPLGGMSCPHVALNTPYVLVGTTKKDWARFFERNGINRGHVGYETRLNNFLKRGRDRRYWAEYVFYGFMNYTPDRIFIEGIPDQPETLPCADKYDPSKANHAMILEQMRGLL